MGVPSHSEVTIRMSIPVKSVSMSETYEVKKRCPERPISSERRFSPTPSFPSPTARYCTFLLHLPGASISLAASKKSGKFFCSVSLPTLAIQTASGSSPHSSHILCLACALCPASLSGECLLSEKRQKKEERITLFFHPVGKRGGREKKKKPDLQQCACTISARSS